MKRVSEWASQYLGPEDGDDDQPEPVNVTHSQRVVTSIDAPPSVGVTPAGWLIVAVIACWLLIVIGGSILRG